MNIVPLSTVERQQGGFTHKFILTEADLTVTTAATGQVITLFTIPVGAMIGRVATRLVTAFQDSGDSANNTLTMTIGDSGSAARYLASQELNVNGSEVYNKAGTGTFLAFDAADTLLATFGATASGKTLAALTAGEVHIFAQIIDLAGLSGPATA